MEDTLRVYYQPKSCARHEVLILVLMEDTLRDQGELDKYSKVLILVLMEDTLRGVENTVKNVAEAS